MHPLLPSLLLFTLLPAAAQTITTRTLDYGSGGSTGQYTSQAVVNGNPAIAYYNVTESSLMFARNSAADGSGTWTITTVDFGGVVGQHCSLKVVDGNPAISYYDATNSDLKYVRAQDASGLSWGTPVTLDSPGNVGTFTSLAVVNGNPAISYYDATNSDLKYMRATNVSGSSWGTPATLDSTDQVGFYTSLAVINGNPAISYYDGTNGDLKYIRATTPNGTLTADWGAPVILDSSGGSFTSLAVVNGNPAVSHYNGDLRYVRALDTSGTTWGTPVTLDITGNVGFYTSLAVISGNPAISYYNDTTDDLKYVRATTPNGTLAADWGTPLTLDSTGNVGAYTSLAVISGRPAITYYNDTADDLKTVRASDTSGTTWPTPTIVDSGTQSGIVGLTTSQALINGNPAIAYYDTMNDDLKYMRALDAAGTTWGAPISIDTTGNVGVYTSLAVVNGNPAISYYDSSNLDLKYVRALDTNGATWGAPVTLDSSGSVGTHTSLAVVNGNPAIGYYDSTNRFLKYVRANTPSGTLMADWDAPVTLTNTNASYLGQNISLVVVNGHPAMSYFTGDAGGSLYYVRSTTASGSLAADWTGLKIIEEIGAVGFYPSMAVVNGHPAVSYTDDTLHVLKYSRALDANGTNWGTPAILDSIGTGFVEQNISLVVINGNPAISYYDGTPDDLKYVRSTTASGTLAADWSTPVTLDSIGDVGQFTSLAAVNGNPAISYYDDTEGNLKWATYVVPAPAVSTTAPTGLTTHQVTLNGTVNPNGTTTTALFQYGLTTSYGGTASVTLTPTDGSTAQNVSTALSGLTSASTYHYRLSATNAGGTAATTDGTFVTLTASQGVGSAITTAGLTGPDAELDAAPFDDGVENLLKYAFNMNLTGPDSSTMGPGGGAGLPAITQQGNGPAGIFRFEFVRRIGSGLIYTAKKGESLTAPSWTPLTDVPTVTPIDANWERVVYEEPVNLSAVPRCFGIVEISLP